MKPHSIALLTTLAKKHGGRCLSKEYKGMNQRYWWRCSRGHKWSAVANSLVYRGDWCGVCAGNVKGSIQECHLFAKKKKGRCLSKTYINRSKPLLWECAKGHHWRIGLGMMRSQNSWCKECGEIKGGIKRRVPLNEVRRLASLKGGRFLSRTYIKGKNALYRWRCENGHEWEANLASIQRGSWCPSCYRGTLERCTRICFEKLFKAPFPKTRPPWLSSPSGRLMELDGYNQRLRIAFEHQGRQHYDAKTYYYGDPSKFKKRLMLDRLKKRLCKKRGIKLICVPEIGLRFGLEKLKDFVLSASRRRGLSFPKTAGDIKIDYAPAFKDKRTDRISQMEEIAKKRGGLSYSKEWVGWNHRYKFSCACGYIWKAFPQVIIKKGGWCQLCANKENLKKAREARKPLTACP